MSNPMSNSFSIIKAERWREDGVGQKVVDASEYDALWDEYVTKHNQMVDLIEQRSALNAERDSTCDQLREQLAHTVKTFKDLQIRLAYAYTDEDCGDHCRNTCRMCVLANIRESLQEEIDAAIKATALPEAPQKTRKGKRLA